MAAAVYEACNICRVPIDCEAILQHYGLRAVNIDTLKDRQPDLYDLCLDFSEDSFLFRERKLIFYKDIDPRRTRFSLMHELGHYLMAHSFCSPDEEWEANHFASYILAPRPLIHYLRRPTLARLCRHFDISMQAAEIALSDYNKWRLQYSGDICEWEDRLLVRFLASDQTSSPFSLDRAEEDYRCMQYLTLKTEKYPLSRRFLTPSQIDYDHDLERLEAIYYSPG